MYSYMWWTLGMVCKIYVFYSTTNVPKSQTQCHSQSRPAILLEHSELLSNHVWKENPYVYSIRGDGKGGRMAYRIKHHTLVLIYYYYCYYYCYYWLFTLISISNSWFSVHTNPSWETDYHAKWLPRSSSFYGTRGFIAVTTTARDKTLSSANWTWSRHHAIYIKSILILSSCLHLNLLRAVFP
jgi:hypothetical protein